MAESLAAESGTLANAPKFEVPAIFQEPNDKIVGRFNTPYLTFAHKERKDEYGKLVGKFGGVNEGDMFLIEGDTLTKLDTVKMSLIKVKQYWVEKNASGEILKASFSEMPWPWAEHMDVVALVYLPDRIVVATVNPHTTKCSGFKILADALEECQKPEWGAKSPAHAQTLQINQPFMRFYGEVTLSDTRVSKKSGRPYKTTLCVIKPTTINEVTLLKAFIESPDNNKQLTDVAEKYTFRLKDIEAKAR